MSAACPLCGKKGGCSCRDSNYGEKKSKSSTQNPPLPNIGGKPGKGGYK